MLIVSYLVSVDDSRRPYPQDMDMRRGVLGRLSKSELTVGEGKDGSSGIKLSLPPAKPTLQGLLPPVQRKCVLHASIRTVPPVFLYYAGPPGLGRVTSLYGATGGHVSSSK